KVFRSLGEDTPVVERDLYRCLPEFDSALYNGAPFSGVVSNAGSVLTRSAKRRSARYGFEKLRFLTARLNRLGPSPSATYLVATRCCYAVKFRCFYELKGYFLLPAVT
ncbi:hypothetical protein L0F63_002051, partial [Massospora cicadina]